MTLTKNWILISFRRFLRNKVNSFINIFGLSLGVVVYLLIFIYVKHEFSYDNFHVDRDRIFRLIRENPPSEDIHQGTRKQAVLQAPLADIIKDQVGGVQQVTRLANWGGTLVVETGGKTYYEDSFDAADADLFKILTFTALDGNTEHALETPNTAAISESTALKYFGTTNAVGKVIEATGFQKLGSYTVDLVFKDFPSNSSYSFRLILRFVDFVKAVQPTDLESWHNSNYNYLLKTDENSIPVDVEGQIKQFFVKKYEGTPEDDDKNANYFLEPLADSYLKSDVNFSHTPTNDINRLYMLASIGLFVVLVAGINYVNLTTARSVKRAKEVGIRKVSGASHSALVLQFLTDAFSISVISMAIAVMVTWIIFPSYSEFIGKPIPMDFNDPGLLLSILCIPLLLGLLAGLYPAFVLSSFTPAKVLKGNFAQQDAGNLTRDILTVFQFAISGGLLIAVFVIGQQLSYIQTHNPGYDREHILRVGLVDEGVRASKEVLLNELHKNPNIVATSVASYFPNSVSTQQTREWVGPYGKTKVAFYTTHADYNYIDLFNIKMVKGRNFSPGNPADKNAFLINETAARVYGWEDPVGMQFTGENEGKPGDTVHIIGVMKDFHISSYRSPIAPFRIGLTNTWSWQLAIKIEPTDMPATLAYIEENYKKLATTKLPYSISFFDEDFGKVYKTNRQLGKLINLFSVVAVLIACLGLYGLAVHTTTQRMKEIAVRKIMGAQLTQIMFLLSRKFIGLVLIAFVIAAPFAYFAMNQWLQSFSYHVSVQFSAFAVTVIVMVVIALATVGSQTWRGATRNPADVLRNE